LLSKEKSLWSLALTRCLICTKALNTALNGDLRRASCHDARVAEDLQHDLVGLCGAGWRITLIITPQRVLTNKH
jgi:hypothetical protein